MLISLSPVTQFPDRPCKKICNLFLQVHVDIGHKVGLWFGHFYYYAI